MRFNDFLMFVELHPNESIHFNLCRWMSRIIAVKWLGNRVPYARELAVQSHLMVDVLLLMGASTNLHCRTPHQRALILLKLGVWCYVDRLEKTLMSTCERYHINARTTKDTGGLGRRPEDRCIRHTCIPPYINAWIRLEL
ncbi:hypothetical protein BASA62_005329, partial [Batrachochytrium salamandrivorans]